MKLYNLQGQVVKELKLPSQFNEEFRPDIIKRAVLVIQSNKRQPYGSDPRAGKDYSAKLSRRRRNYRGSYGMGISRVPRKVLFRRGTRFSYAGAVAPGTTGGRRAHPPKSEKIFSQKINKKERLKAIRSAISATNPESLAIQDLEKVKKSKELKQLLIKIKLQNEIQRSLIKRIRSGIGKLRGRKYKKTRGPLIIISDKKTSGYKASKNLQGFDVTEIKSLNTELLAPGTTPGRLTIWSLDSIQKMEKEKLFSK